MVQRNNKYKNTREYEVLIMYQMVWEVINKDEEETPQPEKPVKEDSDNDEYIYLQIYRMGVESISTLLSFLKASKYNSNTL